MKHLAFALVFVLTATPSYAQFGGLGRKLGKAREAKEKVDKARALVITEKEERRIGEQVSQMVRSEFGVYQDEKVTKYVTLVGSVIAQASSRPDLQWEFIVLDTDGVNAFASPGGIVHITRGALGLIKTEAELAGVLAHEIVHITERHTAKSIQKNKRFEVGADIAPGSNAYLELAAGAVYDNIVEKGFDRGDEEESDREGIRLANKVGYDPSGLGAFLTKLAERNKDAGPERNGLFASHPETQGRIDKLGTQIKSEKLGATATVATRYAEHIAFEATPLSEIATVIPGTRGVAGGEAAKDDEDAENAEKKGGGRRLGIGPLRLSKGAQAESTQASASAGNRAVGRDRAAKGGSNPSKLTVPVTPEELAAFKKGIA